MRPKLTKITAAIVGIAAVCVIVFLCRFWQEIQVEWHVYRLRDRPEYLTEIINAPENTPQRLAMVKHLKTEDGQERLFDLYLEVHDTEVPAPRRRVAQGVRSLAPPSPRAGRR